MYQSSTKSTGESDWSPAPERLESLRADDSLPGVCPDKTRDPADLAERIKRETRFCGEYHKNAWLKGPPYPQVIAERDLIDTCGVSEQVTESLPTHTHRPPFSDKRKKEQDPVKSPEIYDRDTSKQPSTRKKQRRGVITSTSKTQEYYNKTPNFTQVRPARDQYQSSSPLFPPAPAFCGNNALEQRYYGSRRFDRTAPWSIVG
ncbi:hypothetical protein V8F06_006555 [Rhypophila decipiens]